MQSWNLIHELATKSQLPWCCMGDFNDLLDPSKKVGSVSHPSWLFNGFRKAIEDFELVDLGFSGAQINLGEG